MNRIIGTQVTFRPEFSKHLVGVVFEIDSDDVTTEAGTGRQIVKIRTRTGKAGKRWSYRLGYVSDLLTVGGAVLSVR